MPKTGSQRPLSLGFSPPRIARPLASRGAGFGGAVLTARCPDSAHDTLYAFTAASAGAGASATAPATLRKDR